MWSDLDVRKDELEDTDQLQNETTEGSFIFHPANDRVSVICQALC